MQGLMRRFMKPSHVRDEIVQTGILAISVYGMYVLLDRYVWKYLFMQTRFVMFDTKGNPLAFFFDLLALFVLFWAIGFCLSKRRTL